MNASNIKKLLPRTPVGGVQVEDPLRGQPPETMEPFFRALSSAGGGLTTWLVPHRREIGVHWLPDPDVVWLTIIDDLDPAAAGPGSFDAETLQWWTERAEVFVVDAAKPHPRKYLAPAAMLAQGRLVLVLQTPEERREEWHRFFRQVRDLRTPTLMVDIMNGTAPGVPNCRVRAGPLGTDFAADAPYMPHPRPDALGARWPGAGGWQDHNPQ